MPISPHGAVSTAETSGPFPTCHMIRQWPVSHLHHSGDLPLVKETNVTGRFPLMVEIQISPMRNPLCVILYVHLPGVTFVSAYSLPHIIMASQIELIQANNIPDLPQKSFCFFVCLFVSLKWLLILV